MLCFVHIQKTGYFLNIVNDSEDVSVAVVVTAVVALRGDLSLSGNLCLTANL